MHRIVASLRSKIFQGLREEAAAAAIEFSLLLPVMMMLVLGAIDLGRLGFSAITVANAARTGAIVCIEVSPAQCNPTNYSAVIEDAVQGEAAPYVSIGSIASGAISPTYPSILDPYLSVKIQHQFNALVPYPGLPNSYTIVVRSRMPVN